MHRKRPLIAVVLSILIVISIFTGIFIGIWNNKDLDDKQLSDVIIVLGSACDSNEPTPVFKERIHHGIWLYENGYAPYLLFTGGLGTEEKLSEAKIAKNYAISQGVPESVIILEDRATNTEENMQFSKQIMDERGFATALLVSDGLHMKRAMLMANDYGITAYPSPTPTTMYKTFHTQFPFALRETFVYAWYRITRLFH